MSDLTCDSKTQTSLRIERERLGDGGGGESIGEGTCREKDKNISIVVSE